TVGTFTQQALKSSWGEAEWLRFFALMGSSLALREGTPTVPDTPTDPDELVSELRRYAAKLDVLNRLTAYGQALRMTESAAHKGQIFLIELDVGEEALTVWAYDDSQRAAEEYGALERAIADNPGRDAVLVGVESLAALRRA